jgi:hypothetical protein
LIERKDPANATYLNTAAERERTAVPTADATGSEHGNSHVFIGTVAALPRWCSKNSRPSCAHSGRIRAISSFGVNRG